MPFSSYDAHALRLLWHAHSEAMGSLQKLGRPFTESERHSVSKRVVENLSRAYDTGLREPDALHSAAVRGVRLPSGRS
jgi:hypothetical protein